MIRHFLTRTLIWLTVAASLHVGTSLYLGITNPHIQLTVTAAIHRTCARGYVHPNGNQSVCVPVHMRNSDWRQNYYL